MQAIIVETFGGPDQLKWVRFDDPEPAADEVVIAVSAAGVGYVDVMAREGRYVFPNPGFIPGLEVAGKIVALGKGVDEDWLGRQVLALPQRGGGYAERVALKARDLIPLPPDIPPEDAIGIGVNALVAAFSLDRAHVSADERVLIRGAGGGIGLWATQLGARLNADVTATTSTRERGERLRNLGARSLWNHRTDPPLSSGSFDVVIDAIGGPQTPSYVDLLRANGRYVLCGGIEGAPPADFGQALLGRFHQSLSFAVFSLNSMAPQQSRARLAPLFDAVQSGDLSAVIDRRFPLHEAEAAHLRLQSGEAFGKILLEPRPAER